MNNAHTEKIAPDIRAEGQDSKRWGPIDNMPKAPARLLRSKKLCPTADGEWREFVSQQSLIVPGRNSAASLRTAMQWHRSMYDPKKVELGSIVPIAPPDRVLPVSMPLTKLKRDIPKKELDRAKLNVVFTVKGIRATTKDEGFPAKAVASVVHLLRTTTGIDVYYTPERLVMLGTLVYGSIEILDRGVPNSCDIGKALGDVLGSIE